MANVTALAPLDMANREIFFGNVDTATSSLIVISNGPLRSEYRGEFTYDAQGRVSGTLRDYREFRDGVQIIDYNTLAADARSIFNAIQANDFFEASRIALSGDDIVAGSSGDDFLFSFDGNDDLRGGSGHDILNGGSGDDIISGDAGDDILSDEIGDNFIRGGNGIDTVTFLQSRAEYTITVESDGRVSVVTPFDPNGLTTVETDVEIFEFLDGTFERREFTPPAREGSIASGNPGADGVFDEEEIALLYEATLDRVPDQAGLNFWINEAYGSAEFTVLDIAEEFYFSPEFEQLVGDEADSLSNAELVEELYFNVLDRTGLAAENDPDGFAFWLRAANDGLSRPELVRFFAISEENISNSQYVFDLEQQEDGGWIF